jgi:hypothetical protein
MNQKMHMGIDQNGDTYHLGKKPIVKTLLDKTGYQTAKRMYQDGKDGNPKHCGYVLTLRGYQAIWVTLYEVNPFGGVA